MPAEDPNENQDDVLMSGEKAIRDDFGGSGEPSDKQEETFERKVDEAKDRPDS